MQKADKLDHAAKVVAMYVPPVVMALLGLLLQSKKSGRASAVARGRVRQLSRPRRSTGIARPRQWRRIARASRSQRRRSPCSGGAKLDLSRAEDHTSHCNR